MIKPKEYYIENKILNNEEFVDLLPYLTLQDLLSTEYKEDIKWNRLIQLKDSSKQLYQCCVCGVVQSGVKNLFAHMDGKRHMLKMTVVKQFHQPKYTFEERNIETWVTSKNKSIKPHQSLKGPLHRSISENEKDIKIMHFAVSDNEKPSRQKKNKDINVGAVKRSENMNIYTSSYKTENTVPKVTHHMYQEINNPTDTEKSPDKSENIGTLSPIVVIDHKKEKNFRVEVKELHANIDVEPPPKRAKMVLNPAAMITTKVDNIKESYLDRCKPEYQTNITIIPTTMKCNENTRVETGHYIGPLSTRNSCNPLDDDVHGLIGVEYVVKILKNPNDMQPKYECGLCEIIDDGLGMQNHLIGYKHRLKFCDKHFPTALRQYRQYIRNTKPNDIYKVMTPILNRLAIAIEQHHGRELPYECLENEFNENRHEILSKVFSCRHATEQYGPTFTHIIGSKEVDKLVAEIDKYQPNTKYPHCIVFDLHLNSTPFQTKKCNRKGQCDKDIYTGYDANPFSPSLHRRSDEKVSKIQIFDNEIQKLMVEDFMKYNNLENPQSPTNSTSPICKLSSQRKSLFPLSDNDLRQTYQHLVDQKIKGLNYVFQIYRADPESHPAYDQEWQQFWKRRKNELIEAGLNHRTYNYQPEWVRFFNIRIEELYNQAVENIKIDAREMLYFSMANKNSLEDGSKKCSKNELKCIDDYTRKPQIVSVLRLLTALKQYLGNLGPQILDLLSKVLQAEKNNPDELDAIILTGENFSILETAMEKFKGLIMDGIFDNTKRHALRKAIAEVECLLSQTTKRMRKSYSSSNFEKFPEQKQDICKEKLLFTSILARVDKEDLALKLANLLAAQGKKDIDPVQLQKIVSVYMLIEKKKQESLIYSKGDSNLQSQNNLRYPPSQNF